MGESQFAKDLRREVKAQTALAAAAYEESVASRAFAEQAARHNEDAYIAASNVEYYSAEQLNEQREHNEAIRAHHFAVWRQETVNGKIYEDWRERASSFHTKFEHRWQDWLQAQREDVAAVRNTRQAQMIGQFKLNSRLHRFAAHVTSDIYGMPWWPTTVLAFILCVISALVGYAVSAGMQSASFGHVWALTMFGVFLFVTIGWIALVPVAYVHERRTAKGRDWVETEVDAFAKLFPRLWGESDDWNAAYAVHETITEMPNEYVNFTNSMLVTVPERQPLPLPESSLPIEAIRTRALLASWR